jgi:hypothetical protein
MGEGIISDHDLARSGGVTHAASGRSAFQERNPGASGAGRASANGDRGTPRATVDDWIRVNAIARPPVTA